MILANSIHRGLLVTTTESSHNVQCTQHATTSSAAVTSMSSSSFTDISLPVNNEPIAGSVEQEIGVVTTSKHHYKNSSSFHSFPGYWKGTGTTVFRIFPHLSEF